MKFGWPLALSVFLISIHTKIDQAMIGNMLDIEQAGIYSVAFKLSEAWLFFPAILVSTFISFLLVLETQIMSFIITDYPILFTNVLDGHFCWPHFYYVWRKHHCVFIR